MSDILAVVLCHPSPDAQANIQGEMERILQVNDIPYTRVSPTSVQALIPFSLLKCEEKLNGFQNNLLIATICYERSVLSVKATICDDNAMPVKAASLPQKIFLIKYTLALNQKDSDFQVKIHPITGEIELQNSFYVQTDVANISESVYLSLNNFRAKSETISKILEALEIIPSQSDENSLFNKLMEKIEPLRSFIVDSLSPELKTQSAEETSHKNLFFVEERKKVSLGQSTNFNMIQKIRKTYVEDNLSYFVHNSTKVKLSNFVYLALDSTPYLQTLLKSIESQDFLAYNDFRTESFSCEGREIRIEYKSQKPETINYQYSLVDKISRKKNYFTFLKEYIIVRNHLQITNHYLLTKKYEEEVQTLQRYIEKSKSVLSLETKMRLTCQIISIACLCLERMENFQPCLGLSNFLVDRNFNLKLNGIEKSQVDPKLELLQAIYWLIFSKRYFLIKQSEIKVNKFNSIENESLKFIGPTVVMKIMLKSLQNYEKKMNSNKNIETLLLLVNRVSETFEKVANGHEDFIECL